MLVDLSALPVERASAKVAEDWLAKPSKSIARVMRTADSKDIVLTNGLVRRVFRVAPNCATVGIDNLMTGSGMLRAVKPEGRITIDGQSIEVGGLTGQPDRAYLLPKWIDALTARPGALQFAGFTTGKTAERMTWKRAGRPLGSPWPPLGAALTLRFKPPAGSPLRMAVDVHYEMYDGLPVYAKWLTISNTGDRAVRLDTFTAEIAAFVENESAVGAQPVWRLPDVHVATDYMFGGDTAQNANKALKWATDPEYDTQINYERTMPCVLETSPPLGPAVDIAPGASLDTFSTFVLLHDSTERERQGMAVRRMYRALAPWTCESPLMLHLTSVNPQTVRTAIDQCAEVGFEMVIFSFGSGLNMEDDSPANIARFKEFADYAHGKGIRIGGYSLLASRSISPEHDAINPKTGKPGGAIFGSSPCLGSAWGISYFRRVKRFLEGTGFDLLEHDGSYPGDVCASTTHPGHRGLEDSQWTQFQQIAELYRWCRARAIHLNVPDWYYLSGSNKSAMGYRETNWSLPRDLQHLHARQNLFDGTWEKTPTMGWMFTPLVEYQGGGAAATIEPLKDHLPDYEKHLVNNLAYGAQACYRGPRLYDSEETKELVKCWVAFFKAHRDILESDVVHLRRADGRDLDAVLHVNPALPECALAFLWNPTDVEVAREVVVPLAYAGVQGSVRISERDGKWRTIKVDPFGKARVKVKVPAGAFTWLIFRAVGRAKRASSSVSVGVVGTL